MEYAQRNLAVGPHFLESTSHFKMIRPITHTKKDLVKFDSEMMLKIYEVI